MATIERPVRSTWPTTLAVGVSLEWFAVLALSGWLGSNGPRPIQAWFVAYPMFALYPGVVALAASRARFSAVVVAVATLIPMAALWLALLPDAVGDTPFGVRDDRAKYAVVTLVCGIGLLFAARTGSGLMRRGLTVVGFVVAGAIFVITTAIAFFPAIVLTT